MVDFKDVLENPEKFFNRTDKPEVYGDHLRFGSNILIFKDRSEVEIGEQKFIRYLEDGNSYSDLLEDTEDFLTFRMAFSFHEIPGEIIVEIHGEDVSIIQNYKGKKYEFTKSEVHDVITGVYGL